ncbi:MAG TPA: substrate-binding domain-containing protein [Solirubrobacter sp.]|nr:substrate-binding domain-containing protein [Solirubrobacter sp.]
MGKLQANSLLDALKAKGDADGSIVMINGRPTDHNAELFKRGAHSVFDDSPIKVAKEYDTPDWSPDAAQREMEQAIAALGRGGFDGVYTANDGTAGGAIAALKGAGLDSSEYPGDRPGRGARRADMAVALLRDSRRRRVLERRADLHEALPGRLREGGAGLVNDALPRLRLEGMTKRFGGVEALVDADFEVYAGEVVALVGDNGRRQVDGREGDLGRAARRRGTVSFDGELVPLRRPQDAAALGIATVYQDLALCDNLDVVANLFLGRELVAGGAGAPARVLDGARMERRSRELLDSLRVRTLKSVHTAVGSLSGGQRQSVAIARSLLGEPSIVLLDEPTAALGVEQTEEVLALIERLRSRELGVVVISHNLADVFEVADRIVVLRLGRVAATFDASETSSEEVVAAITGAGERTRGR